MIRKHHKKERALSSVVEHTDHSWSSSAMTNLAVCEVQSKLGTDTRDPVPPATQWHAEE
jgi:hypothetical protein